MFSRKKVISFFLSLSIAVFCALAFQVGYHLANHPADRLPAAIPRGYDYSHLEGSALKQAAQDRLVRGVKVIVGGGASGLELGHFVQRNDRGEVVGACEIYKELELKFAAGDMAISGEPPEMVVNGPCRPADDANWIAPIMVPYTKILQLPVRDVELANFDDASVKISFHNMSDSWPRVWVLQSVKITSPNAEILEVSTDDIRRVLGQLPSLEWK